MAVVPVDPAVEAYATLAPHYEALTRDYPHERWMHQLEALARKHGLADRRVLDVGCGTGKSLRPLLALGYEGSGCDLSAEMLAVARRRLPSVPLHLADMRALPDLGTFPWITCMDDALNYLLQAGDLRDALTSMARLLEPGGLLTFDLNTLGGHRAQFDQTWAIHDPEAFLCWEGKGREKAPGEPGTSEITVFARSGSGWEHATSRHRQRWWSADDVMAACRPAALQLVARYGQRPGAVIRDGYDELEDSKVIYFLRRP